ncbi:unnamed protein product [Rhodiola kirilowii]
MAARDVDIQGHLLQVTVLRGIQLKETNTFTNQNPFVKLEYGSKERRTVTVKGGGANPSFQDRFEFKLIQGIEILKVTVYNERTLGKTILIGTGEVNLGNARADGSLECTCLLFNNFTPAGEIRLLLIYPNAGASSSSSTPNHGAPATPNHHYGQWP